ncbi:MAG: TonB-dependent receptor [Pseudomonadota bacterium]
MTALRLLPFRLSLLGAAMAALAPAHAQDNVQDKALAAAPLKAVAPAPLQQVEVRANAYNARRDDTASKIVVNHDEILKYGDGNVLDVLKRLPGVTVSNGSVRMRGLGAGYTQVLLNGERMPAGFSLDQVAPELIERIEVMRSASAETSTQAIAGTINIVLKKAISAAQRELKLGMRGAQGVRAASANLQLSDRDGRFSYSFTLNASHQDNGIAYHTLDEARGADGQAGPLRRRDFVSDGRYSGVSTAPRLNWTLAGGDTLTWQSYAGAAYYKGAELGAEPGAGSSDRAVKPSRVVRSDLSWSGKLAGGAKLESKIGVNWFSNHNDNRQRAFDGNAPDWRDRSIVTTTDELGYSFTGKYSTPIVPGHALAAGWDAGGSGRTDGRMQRERVAANAPGFDKDEDFTTKVRRLAVYAQDEWDLTPRWSVYLGARWEGIDTRSAGSAFAAVGNRSSVLSPLFQTLYKLPGNKGDQLRLAVTRTYRAPGAGNLMPRRFYAANNGPGEPDEMGNPDLKPELAFGVDASYEHHWAGGALLSVSASTRRIDDFIQTSIEPDAIGYVAIPNNNGRAVTHGLELEAKFPLKALIPKAMGHSAPAIELRASVSRNWSKVAAVPGPDNRIDQQTPLSANLGLDYTGAALSAGASFAWRGGGPVRVSARERGYTTVQRDLDAYLLWKRDAKTQLRLSLVNLLKSGWSRQSSYTDALGASARRTQVKPGAVELRARLELKY